MPNIINGISFPDDASEAEVLAFFEEHPDLVGGDGQTSEPSAAGHPLDATLKGMGLSDDDLAALNALDKKQPGAAANLSILGGLLGPWGAGAGAAAGTLMEGGSAKEAATSGALNVIVPKAIEGAIGKLRQPVANLLRRGAVRTMKSAIKPDRGYLEKMAGSKRGGIAKMETEIAETALDRGVNPVRRSGMDKLQGLIDDASAKRTTMINAAKNAPIRGSAAAADRAALKALAKAKRGDAPQDDIAAVSKFIEDMRTSPQTTEVTQQAVSFADEASPLVGPSGERIGRLRAVPGKEVRGLKDLTPRESADVIEAGNDRLRGLFGGQSKNAEIQARLKVQRARTRKLDAAAGTGDVSQEMKRLIDLRNVGNIATRRAESNNPISLTDVISLSAGRPAVLAGSVGMKAPIQADIAQLLNRAGKSVGTPSERAELLRRLLAAYGVTEATSER